MKVLLAMSGGVDSSTCAGILLSQGHSVTGVTFITVKDLPGLEQSIKDAKKVAHDLGFDHIVKDISVKFRQKVIGYASDEYNKGRTPNPCVMCNKIIKFSILKELSKELDMEAIATGHYVRIGIFRNKKVLRMAAEKKRSQEYFLSYLDQSVLDSCIFPVGELTKTNVREKAQEHGLSVSDKQDSQDICFIPKGATLLQALPELFPEIPGDIVDLKGRKLGQHKGCHHYTIGQRKGLNLACGKPMYVIAIKPEKNLIIVAEKEHIYSTSLQVKIRNQFVENMDGLDLSVRIRSQSLPVPCTVDKENDNLTVTLREPVWAVTPGQIACFYVKDMVVMAGEIV